MRILVVGAGATGGYFGGRLAAAGKDVTFLVRPKRAEQLRSGGLQIKSQHGDVSLQPKLLISGEASAPFDAVIFAVKAYGLEGALADLAPFVGPGTMIVPLLNGMRHLDLLVERFGEAPVLGGVCLIASTIDADGKIIHLADFQEIGFGERSGEMSARVESLKAAMQGAVFKARASATIMQDMWEKWVMLSSLGGLTCLLRGNVGEIEAVPGGTAIALDVLGEATAVATASGYPPREAHANRSRGMLTAKGLNSASSMYRDLNAGLPVEVDQILGDMVRRGGELGVPTPLLAAATAQLRIYGSRRAAA